MHGKGAQGPRAVLRNGERFSGPVDRARMLRFLPLILDGNAWGAKLTPCPVPMIQGYAAIKVGMASGSA